MMGAENFKNIEKLSERRFENCQLGKQAKDTNYNLKIGSYDSSLALIGRSDLHMPDSEKDIGGFSSLFDLSDAIPMQESLKDQLVNEKDESSEIGEALTEKEKQQLMPEILNPESEFGFQEFDFGSKGLGRSLEYFARPDWDGLSVEDKKRIVSSYIGELTLGLDISKMPKVNIRQMPENFYGAYKGKENIIDINSKLLDDPKELANTIAHEMRHAYQHERAKMGETHLDKLYGLNFENYIRPVKDENGSWIAQKRYENQLVEAEAYAFAEKIADMMEGMR